jgi:hypothetical protein
MSLDVTNARQKFVRSMAGKWKSYLGGGNDISRAVRPVASQL